MVVRSSTTRLVKFVHKKHPLDPWGSTRIFHSICVPRIKADVNRIHQVPIQKFLPFNRRMISIIPPLSTGTESSTTKSSYDRNYITEERALNEFLLSIVDLQGLRVTIRRSANEHDPPHKVYWRKDVEQRAVLR